MSPKPTLLAVLALGCVFAAFVGGMWFGGGKQEAGQSAALEDLIKNDEHITQYTCSMHPFIIRDEPGNCPICSMTLVPVKNDATGAKSGPAKTRLWKSPMDPTYVRDAPGKDAMGHDLVPVSEEQAASGISIDPVTMQNMGVRFAKVIRRDLSKPIRAVGLVVYPESRQYSINSKIEGWVERLYVNETGQTVKAGQPLMDIYSPALVAAQHEYLLAKENAARLRDSSLPDARAGADRLVESSRTRLRYWDISDAQLRRLEQTREVRKNLTLFSPYAGVVSMKSVIQGMRVMGGEELLQISDISTVWVDADIYEYELPWVRLGAEARVEIPYAPEKQLTGTISLIYPYVQNETRTIRARIALPNADYELKPDMYATVHIQSRTVANALSVPDNAVLKSGIRQTVFVRLDQGRFEPREVKTGVTSEDGYVQIVSGVTEGEEVVTSAQFLIDSESKLREVIQKMLQTPPVGGNASAPSSNDDLFK